MDTISVIDSQELAEEIKNVDPQIIDVRNPSEFISEHVNNAENRPLDTLNESMAGLDKSKTYYVHCASGYRSMIFNSILKARGFDNLVDVTGGFKAIKESGLVKTTDFVCPTTLKQG